MEIKEIHSEQQGLKDLWVRPGHKTVFLEWQKHCEKLKIEGNFINLIKSIYEKLTTSIILNGK